MRKYELMGEYLNHVVGEICFRKDINDFIWESNGNIVMNTPFHAPTLWKEIAQSPIIPIQKRKIGIGQPREIIITVSPKMRDYFEKFGHIEHIKGNIYTFFVDTRYNFMEVYEHIEDINNGRITIEQ